MAGKKNILIIGCGAIGTTLAKGLENFPVVDKIYMFDKDVEKVKKFAKSCAKILVADDFDSALSRVDFVVEAASQAAVKQFAKKVVANGKSLLLLSVGALVDEELRETLEATAAANNCKIYLPSGALCGVDGLMAAAGADIEEVVLTSYKPPQALKGVQYLIKKGIQLDNLKSAKVVFEGSASDAVRYFPKNVNVAATISLAGIGFERTKVKIVADPFAKRNTHRIRVKGAFGELECTVRNLPFPQNPKTSYIAALSALAALKKIFGSIWIGA